MKRRERREMQSLVVFMSSRGQKSWDLEWKDQRQEEDEKDSSSNKCRVKGRIRRTGRGRKSQVMIRADVWCFSLDFFLTLDEESVPSTSSSSCFTHRSLAFGSFLFPSCIVITSLNHWHHSQVEDREKKSKEENCNLQIFKCSSSVRDILSQEEKEEDKRETCFFYDLSVSSWFCQTSNSAETTVSLLRNKTKEFLCLYFQVSFPLFLWSQEEASCHTVSSQEEFTDNRVQTWVEFTTFNILLTFLSRPTFQLSKERSNTRLNSKNNFTLLIQLILQKPRGKKWLNTSFTCLDSSLLRQILLKIRLMFFMRSLNTSKNSV